MALHQRTIELFLISIYHHALGNLQGDLVFLVIQKKFAPYIIKTLPLTRRSIYPPPIVSCLNTLF